jgi:hypothetical protein
MAKHFKIPKHNTGRNITTKSAFGSHSNMIISCEDPICKNITLQENQVLCKDDDGIYLTDKSYIDSGLADPNRYGRPESRKIFALFDKKDEQV